MKRFYSLPMAIFYAIFALFFSAWLCVVVMVFKNADEFPISALIVCCLLLAVLILFCMCMVLFSLPKNNDYKFVCQNYVFGQNHYLSCR